MKHTSASRLRCFSRFDESLLTDFHLCPTSSISSRTDSVIVNLYRHTAPSCRLFFRLARSLPNTTAAAQSSLHSEGIEVAAGSGLPSNSKQGKKGQRYKHQDKVLDSIRRAHPKVLGVNKAIRWNLIEDEYKLLYNDQLHQAGLQDIVDLGTQLPSLRTCTKQGCDLKRDSLQAPGVFRPACRLHPKNKAKPVKPRPASKLNLNQSSTHLDKVLNTIRQVHPTCVGPQNSILWNNMLDEYNRRWNRELHEALLRDLRDAKLPAPKQLHCTRRACTRFRDALLTARPSQPRACCRGCCNTKADDPRDTRPSEFACYAHSCVNLLTVFSLPSWHSSVESFGGRCVQRGRVGRGERARVRH